MGKNQSINLPKEEQPKERLLKFGETHLSNQELLSLILGTDDEISKKVLAEFEGLSLLKEATIEELTSLKGVGTAKAASLIASIELGKRMNQYKSNDKFIIRSPKDAADYVMEEMRNLNQENLVVLFLNTKNHIIHKQTIFVGSLDSSIVHPREIFRESVKRSANSLIILHNHPSGDPAPSRQDIEVTKRLKNCGDMMGTPILDHVIIGNRKFTSLKEKGYL